MSEFALSGRAGAWHRPTDLGASTRLRASVNVSLAVGVFALVSLQPGEAFAASGAGVSALSDPLTPAIADFGPVVPTTAESTSTESTTGSVITCQPDVQYPHLSSHVNGTVNVVVTVKCTGTVDRISIRAALYRNGPLVKDSGSKAVTFTRSAQNNAAEACNIADYTGWGSWVVTFLSNYTPRFLSGSGFGSSAHINC